jgi:hypothetical protein
VSLGDVGLDDGVESGVVECGAEAADIEGEIRGASRQRGASELGLVRVERLWHSRNFPSSFAATLTGTEADFITGLKMPVGVLASGPNLLASDQPTGAIGEAPIAMPTKHSVLAQIDGPDLLCEAPMDRYSGKITGVLMGKAEG